jgi:hypothetical protein
MITVNKDMMSANMTHLQAELPVLATTNQLIGILGEPERGFYEDKVTREWVIEDSDSGVVATIYDWKEYREYGDDEAVNWHIGGHNKDAIRLVVEVLTGTKRVDGSELPGTLVLEITTYE